MVLSALFLLSFSIGFLLFFILYKFNAKNNYPNQLLAFYILILSLLSLHNLFTSTEYIYQIPYFFRITKPLTFLAAPFIYLYVRAVLFQEKRIKKKDFLHFIPSVLHLIELLPFYLVSKEIKLQQVTYFMSDMNSGMKANEGLLPNYINEFLLYFLVIIYLLATYMMLYKEKRSFSFPKTQNNVIVYRWLKFFWLLNFLYLTILIVTFMGVFLQLNMNIFLIKTIENAISLLVIGISLFFRPEILYGFNESNHNMLKDNESNKIIKTTIKLSYLQIQKYDEALTHCITIEKPFLQPALTINQLAVMSNIPYTFLSEFINSEKKMNFSEYINFLRIEYATELLLIPENQKYTLNSIAEQSGFNSITSFRRAFVKFKNCTPTEFLNDLKS